MKRKAPKKAFTIERVSEKLSFQQFQDFRSSDFLPSIQQKFIFLALLLSQTSVKHFSVTCKMLQGVLESV